MNKKTPKSARSKKSQSPKPLLIVLSAPSGAGKTTLAQSLLNRCPNLRRAITCTTRPPRKAEVDGKDYHFLTADDFRARAKSGDFLEQAEVHGNHYGSLKSEVVEKLQTGHDVLLAIDVQGAAAVRRQASRDAFLKAALVEVFIVPANPTVLARRLQRRNTDPPSVIKKRLATARHEIAHWKHYDYIIVSGTRAADRRRMLAIYEAEKLRRSRFAPPDSFAGK